MMVGMMVCAVVVVCAEDHNVMRRFSRESVLYPTPAAGVNEFALVSIALVMTLASPPRCFRQYSLLWSERSPLEVARSINIMSQRDEESG